MKLSSSERNQVALLTLSGEFTGGADAPAFRDAVERLRASGRHNVVADVTGVTYMDSSALGALIEAATTLRTGGGDLRLAGMESSPRLIWTTSVFRLHDVFKLFTSVDDAVASFATDAPATQGAAS
jgi:anti-sigma B factor antagonist